MLKSILQLAGVIVILLAATATQAAESDPLTSLPLYPGMQFATKSSQDVCGTNVTTSTYSPSDGKLTVVEGWFATHLKGFKRFHGTQRTLPMDAFVNPDSTLSVSIHGADNKNGVDVVSYHRNAKPASPANLINWLDGGDPLCH